MAEAAPNSRLLDSIVFILQHLNRCWFLSLVPPLLICKVNGFQKLFWNYPFVDRVLNEDSFLFWGHNDYHIHRDVWRIKTRWRTENRWLTNEHFQGQWQNARELVTPRPRMKSLICSVLLAYASFSSFPWFSYHCLSPHISLTKAVPWFAFPSPTFSFLMSLFSLSFSLHPYLATQSLTL